MADRSDLARIQRMQVQIEETLREGFERIVRQAARGIGLAELADLIDDGNLDEAMRIANRVGELFAVELHAATVLAAGDTAAFLSGALGIQMRFDAVNDLAVSALRANRLEFIRAFGDQQRAAVREALADGLARGLNPRAQARAFRGSIGLTQRQVAAVANFRRMLEELDSGALTRQLRDRRFDRTVRKAIRARQPLTRLQINRMVGRYEEKYLRFRSETIARTESLRVVHEGSEMMYQQAIERGDLRPDQLTRVWNTAGDERVRGSHEAMHQQVRNINEPFTSGRGNQLRWPGDPLAPGEDTIQCRCAVGTTVAAPVAVLV